MKKGKAADMLIKVKKLYEQARVSVVSLRATAVSELWEKMEELFDEAEATVLELQTMSGIVEEASIPRNKVAELWKAGTEDGTVVVVMEGLWKEILAVKKGVAELLPAAGKSRGLHVDAEKKARLAEMELFLVKY